MKILKKSLILMATLVISLSVGTFFNSSMANEESNWVPVDTSYDDANKAIDERKVEINYVNAGFGMKTLNRAPIPSFEQIQEGKIEVTIEDGKGFKSIKSRIGTGKLKEQKIDEKTGKVQTYKMSKLEKGKKREVTYVITDVTGLKSTTKCIISNKDGVYKFDTSMRVSFSYSDNNLHLILKDMGGITADNASIEIFDYNTSDKKSVVHVSGKNIKIDKDTQVKNPKDSEKIIYGTYSIPLNKLTPDKEGKYYVRVKTTDCNGNTGYRMAKFEVDKNAKGEKMSSESSKSASKEEIKTEQEKSKAQQDQAKAKDQANKTKEIAKDEQSKAKLQNNQTKAKTQQDQSKAKTYVAQIGKKKYTTLQSAINKVSKNNKQTTIKILKNISQSKALTIAKGKNIVLDTGKYSVKVSKQILNNGALQVKGSGIFASTSAEDKALYNKGTLTITGNVKTSRVTNSTGATLNIKGGTIKGGIGNSGKANISGKSVIDEKDIYSSKSGSYTQTIVNNNTLTISGGTIKNSSQDAIYNSSKAKTTITGGTITAKKGYAIQNAGKAKNVTVKKGVKITGKKKNVKNVGQGSTKEPHRSFNESF